MTDIDRLHAVVQGKLYGRGCGKTFAACHNLAGLLLTAPPGELIIWRLPLYGWLRHIKPMLASILDEYWILECVEWIGPTRMRCLGKEVRFVTGFEETYGLPPVYVVNDYGEWREWGNRNRREEWRREHGLGWSATKVPNVLISIRATSRNPFSPRELRQEYENEWSTKET